MVYWPGVHQTLNEGNSIKKGGGNCSSEMQCHKRFFKKLMECSRVKVTKETWRMDAVPDPGCCAVLKEKSKRLCGSTGKIKIQMVPWC